MTDDSPADDHGAADSEAFEEWLEQAADSKGVSKQEMMNEMLSSYWILDELTGLVGQSEFEGRSDHRTPSPVEAGPETEARSSSHDFDSNERSAEAESSEERESPTEQSLREIHAAVQELIEAQSAGERSTEDTASPFDEGVVSVVSDLQRQVGKFESELEDVQGRQDTQFDRLSNELQLLLDRVNELEHEQAGHAKQSDLETLTVKLNELDGQIEELETADETLKARDQELESRMDREFDSIEELFHRLLNALEELDSELEATTASYREKLEPIHQRETERTHLEELKTEALTREIRRGNCESCGQNVDLALLESPTCPNCSARFTGIGDSGWNPFRAPTLETEMGLKNRT